MASHCLHARITGPSYAPSQYVDFSYADETGEIDTRRFHMKPGVANGDMGGAFYEAIRTMGLTGLALVDGERPDGNLRHPQLGCTVDLYYCSALSADYRNLSTVVNDERGVYTALILAVSNDPSDSRVVALYRTTTEQIKPPSRDTVF